MNDELANNVFPITDSESRLLLDVYHWSCGYGWRYEWDWWHQDGSRLTDQFDPRKTVETRQKLLRDLSEIRSYVPALDEIEAFLGRIITSASINVDYKMLRAFGEWYAAQAVMKERKRCANLCRDEAIELGKPVRGGRTNAESMRMIGQTETARYLMQKIQGADND